jgi:hypothetical protein
MKSDSVKFKYFWKEFNPTNNFFTTLLEDILRNYSEIEPKIRVEFHSVFGRPRRLNSIRTYLRVKKVRFLDHFRGKTMLIWYTGEYVQPPKYYDLTLSYAANSERNIYLPLWATYINLENLPVGYDREIPLQKLKLSDCRKIDLDGKIPKICTFMSKKVSFRFEIAQQLQKAGLLDGYGKAFGNTVTSKIDVASKYLFQLCLENNSIEGYVTEKPVEAWLAGNIPIYINSDIYNYLNPDAIIDIKGIDVHQIVSKVESIINEDLDIYFSNPILLRNYDTYPIQKSILKFFNFSVN